MAHFRHILFPTDFSERCRQFATEVADVAQHTGARITLIHALESIPGCYGGIFLPSPPSFNEVELRASARRHCCGLLEEFRHKIGLHADAVIEDGEPGAAISNWALANGVDLIMMPTHGCGGFRRLVAGSLAARILHSSRCAVWTAAHDETPHCRERKTHTTILCGLSLDPESGTLMRCAKDVADEFGADLRFVHAVTGVNPDDTSRDGAQFRQFLFDTAREGLADIQASAGVVGNILLSAGKIGAVLRTAALGCNADLVVVGKQHVTATFGSLRSHVYDIINQAPCCVLST